MSLSTQDGAHHRIDAEIAVAHKERFKPMGTVQEAGGQRLLAGLERTQGAIQNRTGAQTEPDDHTHDAPIRWFFAIAGAVRREMLGDVTQSPQSKSRAIQQHHSPTPPPEVV